MELDGWADRAWVDIGEAASAPNGERDVPCACVQGSDRPTQPGQFRMTEVANGLPPRMANELFPVLAHRARMGDVRGCVAIRNRGDAVRWGDGLHATSVRATVPPVGAPNYPLAYLLTWTCYGTWLHGDGRGSVDVMHNAPGTPYLPPDERRFAFARRALRHPSVTLDGTARTIVHDAVIDHARMRGWEVLALNVRTNHVHAVIRCGSYDPSRVVRQFKDWGTRRLRATGKFDRFAKVWTDGGSTRYLWTERSVASATSYVHDRQGAELNEPSPLRKQRESGSAGSTVDHCCHPSRVREHGESGSSDSTSGLRFRTEPCARAQGQRRRGDLIDHPARRSTTVDGTTESCFVGCNGAGRACKGARNESMTAPVRRTNCSVCLRTGLGFNALVVARN